MELKIKVDKNGRQIIDDWDIDNISRITITSIEVEVPMGSYDSPYQNEQLSKIMKAIELLKSAKAKIKLEI